MAWHARHDSMICTVSLSMAAVFAARNDSRVARLSSMACEEQAPELVSWINTLARLQEPQCI